MKVNHDCKTSVITLFRAPTRKKAKMLRACSEMCGLAGMAGALLCASPAGALSITTISQGHLASGKIIQVVQIVIGPGETIPWHYHTGMGWVTVVSGTLSEDVGCGTPLVSHSPGTSVPEEAGHVHRLFNFGQEPVVFTGVLIFPDCDPNNGTVFIGEPSCEGNSGNSHREPIPNCKD